MTTGNRGRSARFLRSLALLVVGGSFSWQSATCLAQLEYTGVDLSGAEFGNTPTPGNLGTYNTDYTYPTDAEIDYFISKGMNTFRIPFRWERLQPTLDAPLNTTEFNRLNSLVQYATSKGANVILDPHNFARYYPDPNNFESSTQGLIGSASVPDSAFADLWSRLATDYKGNSHVFFGLMNEPNTMPTEQWVSAANAGIAAIRAAGATNLVLVPGNAWTGASSWSDNWYGTPNATAMLNIVDPGHNFAIEVHQYMDADGSGNSSTIANNDPNIGVERLTDFTQWLEAHNLKGFLGEFAVANSTIGTGSGQIGDETINNMLNYMQANSSAWLGYSWWAAGPWWGNYQFTLEPTNLGTPQQADQPAMSVLGPRLAGVMIAGDANRDGVVNGLDIGKVASNWLQTGSGNAGDVNRDGVVNGLDISLIAANWLHAGGGTATSVPEPSTAILAGIGACLLWGRSRRKRR
ncbi:MAG TPA: cellulase family glycosylhydrolase [Pirellulales bacterium]